MAVIAPYFTWTRTQTSLPLQNSTETQASQARKAGLKVAAGCWLSTDLQANQTEIAALIADIQRGNVDIAVVGNETLYRGDLTEDQLLAYMRQVKAAGAALVTTADTSNVLLTHPRVCAACDVLMANDYKYWEGFAVDGAIKQLNKTYDALVAASGGKQVIIGETGWPSAGNVIGHAIPSPENAAAYWVNFVSWARARGVEYFYFEAIDEPWKAQDEGPQGAHWGLWEVSSQLKTGMMQVFNGVTIPDNWTDNVMPTPAISAAATVDSGTPGPHTLHLTLHLSSAATNQVSVDWQTVNGSATAPVDYTAAAGTVIFPPGALSAEISLGVIGNWVMGADRIFQVEFSNPRNATIATPTVQVTLPNTAGPVGITISQATLPVYAGASGSITGTTSGVDPAKYKVACFLYVNGGWWTKPYADTPFTTITSTGAWTCNVVTGGSDNVATQYAAYLLPKVDNAPLPVALGASTIPTAITAVAVAHDIKVRPAP